MYLYMHCIVIFWNHAPLIDGVSVLFSCWRCSGSDAAWLEARGERRKARNMKNELDTIQLIFLIVPLTFNL